MKFICTQENLNKALNIVGRITNKNSTLPILNNVLLKTEKGRLKLSSTNLEIGVNYLIGGKVEEDGEITVPTKLFANFVSNLPSGNVEIKLRDDILNIKCNGYKTNIKGLDAKEYPLAPKIEVDPIFKIKSADFKKALTQISPAISSSESRIEITGVFMNLSEISKNKVILVATDSYRLAEKNIDLEKNNINKEFKDILGNINSVIIPKDTVQELMRSLDENEEMLEITISENQILFNFGSASIISRLIEGKYPDYKQIIPEKFELQVIINKNEIIKGIRVASLFSNVSNNSIELKLLAGSKNIEISSETSDLGNNNTKIPAENINKSLNILYNHKFLMDGFNSLEGDEVFLQLNNETLPTVLTSAVDKGFIYVIMPTRA
ncbi:MAG: DNA polymerase III subunit beta [Candidatus Andersenbacteria bacterium]|nr:DNA polymerase III subunit beta [Candidatus Andersenbacteria bacterium]